MLHLRSQKNHEIYNTHIFIWTTSVYCFSRKYKGYHLVLRRKIFLKKSTFESWTRLFKGERFTLRRNQYVHQAFRSESYLKEEEQYPQSVGSTFKCLAHLFLTLYRGQGQYSKRQSQPLILVFILVFWQKIFNMQTLQRKQTIPYVNSLFTSIEHLCAIISHIISSWKNNAFEEQ